MRLLSCMLFIIVLFGCAKQPIQKRNFVEFMLADQKISFDSVEAIIDTTNNGIGCDVRGYIPASNSYITLHISTGLERIKGDYEYPWVPFPGRSISYLDLQLYINGFSFTYALDGGNHFAVTIDHFGEGVIHGTFSGTITCFSCTVYHAITTVTDGEFEMPYTYR